MRGEDMVNHGRVCGRRWERMRKKDRNRKKPSADGFFQAVEKPLYKQSKKTGLPVFFLIPGAGPDVKGAEGGETENFCPVPRKGQKFSVDRTLDRRDTGHAAAEGRRKNHIFSACLQFSHGKQSFLAKAPVKIPEEQIFFHQRSAKSCEESCWRNASTR